MKLVKAAVLIACVTVSVLVVGQTISITDDYSDITPVPLKGTVTFNNPENLDCVIAGFNKSSKPIIAFVIEMNVTTPNGQPGIFQFSHDNFFKSIDISSPQSEFKIDTGGCPLGHEIGVERIPSTPAAHARLLFVQYNDASAWGDAKVGNKLLAQRAALLQVLQTLKTAYTDGGSGGLEKALSEDQKLGSSLNSKLDRLRVLRDAYGIKAVVDDIDKDLATMKAREALVPK
jgi:hypothetical protein